MESPSTVQAAVRRLLLPAALLGVLAALVPVHARADGGTLGLLPPVHRAPPKIAPAGPAGASPVGYIPCDVSNAYRLGSLGLTGSGTLIAIVDAFDQPTIQADLHTFDATFGLPDPPSFTVQKLGSPGTDRAWGDEITMDVEWAHAAAPGAAIALVEAADVGLTAPPNQDPADLGAAIGYAVQTLDADVVSMSFGGPESELSQSDETTLDQLFPAKNAAGRPVTYVAATGDLGFGPDYPAVSTRVVAVGGTSLAPAASGYRSQPGSHTNCAGATGSVGVTSANETVWGAESSNTCPNGVCGTGGGRSIRLAKPVWQATVQGSSRSIPDVSMLADPYTGVATYESGAWNGFLMGGTSLATPLWAAMVALLDQGRRARGLANLGVSDTSAWLYSTSGDNFNDVVTGSSPAAPNDSCLQDGSCVAQPGYDLVTGRGSPFMPSLAADVTGTGVSTVKGNYVPVSPQRIMDTRSGAGGVQRAPMGSGQTVQVHLTGAASQASALAVNVAVTNAAGMSTGYVLVYPCGQTRPYASTLNFTAGRTAAVLAQVQVADGCLAVYLNTAGGVGTADVFLDLEGYFSAGSTGTVGLYNPLSTPYRAVDTRSGLGGHSGPLGAGEAWPLQVAGSASLKTSTAIPSDAAAVVLNLLAISGTAASYLSVYPAVKGANPCPANLTSSNLNFPPQRVVANRVTTAVGDGGRICFYNSAGRVDITADLSGWYSGGQGDDTKGLYFSAWTPVRIYDTRSAARLGPGTSTCPGANITVPVTPGSAPAAAALSVTGLDASSATYLQAFPTGTAPSPPTSDVNYGPGDVQPNLVVSRLGSSQSVTVCNSSGQTHFFVDVEGMYVP